MSLQTSITQKNQSIFDSQVLFDSFTEKRSWEPSWLIDYRRKHWHVLNNLPQRLPKDEGWRFSNRSRFGFSKVHKLEESASSMNLRYKSSPGTRFDIFEKMILDRPDELSTYIDASGPNLGANESFHLIASFANSGFFLKTGNSNDQTQTFRASHILPSKSSATFHRNIIALQPFTEAILFETINSNDWNSSALLGNFTQVELGEGAKLKRVLVQSCNPFSTLHQLEHFQIGKNASLTNVTIHLGSSQSRVETKGTLLGEGAEFENFSLFLGQDNQLFDQRTMQHHIAPHGRSNLVCKNALSNKSKSIFSGMIKVDNSAISTDAYQSNRNLLLSNKAEADSLPGLEILANEVKCSHGATTSRIDQGELFYLLARGIPRPAAEKLIALGFFEEIIEKIGVENEIESIRKKIEFKFEG